MSNERVSKGRALIVIVREVLRNGVTGFSQWPWRQRDYWANDSQSWSALGGFHPGEAVPCSVTIGPVRERRLNVKHVIP